MIPVPMTPATRVVIATATATVIIAVEEGCAERTRTGAMTTETAIGRGIATATTTEETGTETAVGIGMEEGGKTAEGGTMTGVKSEWLAPASKCGIFWSTLSLRLCHRL